MRKIYPIVLIVAALILIGFMFAQAAFPPNQHIGWNKDMPLYRYLRIISGADATKYFELEADDTANHTIKTSDLYEVVSPFEGASKPIEYIYPLTFAAHRHDWAGAAGHDLDIYCADSDPTSATLINTYVSATVNDDDDYDYITWTFYLPNNFDGFLTAALTIDTYSTSNSNTDMEISLACDGSFDATIAALDINPDADADWQTKTSAVGTAWSSSNAGQECTIKIKFLGDATNELRVRNLKLAYYRSN